MTEQPSRLPTTEAVIGSLRTLLPHLPVRVVAGLVYGSVATGRHHAGSDVDALLIVDRRPSAQARAATVEQYRSFQLALGFRPDPRHPLELFGVDDCRHVVTGEAGAHGQAHAALPEASDLSPADAQEILHALVAPHRVVVGELLVDELRTAARRHLGELPAPSMVNRSDPR